MFPSNLMKKTNFPNMAGRKYCDQYIEKELTEAGIPIVYERGSGEVPYNTKGCLGKMNFERAWYYWMVDCRIPLAIAKELYADPIGQCDVRVVGHCGCPPPEEWATPDKELIRKYIKENNLPFINMIDIREAIKSGKLKGELYIHSYHIDSQEGLNLFVATVKKYGLDKEGM